MPSSILCRALVLACVLVSLLAQQQPPPPPQEVTPDKWPEFEVVPAQVGDPDYTQIHLSRTKDTYLAVNTDTDATTTAQLLIGDMLEAQGYSPEESYVMQTIVSALVQVGVLEVHSDKIATTDLNTLLGIANASGGKPPSDVEAAAAAAAPAAPSRRKLQMDGCCPCNVGHHPKPTGPPHYKQQVLDKACEHTLKGCAAEGVQVAADRRSTYKTLKAYGLALRRTAAARSYYLYLQDEVHSYDEFSALSEADQEATRKEMAAQLLLTCKEYGLKGEELHKYAAPLGLDVPDLTRTSDAELKRLGGEMAAQHAMEKVATAMGKDLGKDALIMIRDSMGDAMLRRIGVEPSPALNSAFTKFATEASRFITLSREAMAAQGIIDPATESAYMNATATADRIAATMEKVNMTDLLLTATGLMLEAEPYLTDAIDNPVDDATRAHKTQPWELVLKLSQLQKAAQQERKSFTVGLKEDNALDGLVLLHESGRSVESPLMQQLNFTAIEEMTADHMLDATELRALVSRVGALNEVYSVDDFAELMAEVEDNYLALHGLPPVRLPGDLQFHTEEEDGAPRSSSTPLATK